MQQAQVRWFDGKSGEGMVRLSDGRTVFVHFTAIKGISPNNGHWPTEADQKRLESIGGRLCMVEVYEDFSFQQISKLILDEAI